MGVEPKKGGQEVGKRTASDHFEPSFSDLFPSKSTQVVDFPHLSRVRHIRGNPEMGIHGRNADNTWMEMTVGNRRAWNARPTVCVRVFIAILETERSLMFAYVRLKSLMFAYFE